MGDNLNNNSTDYIVSAFKGALGAADIFAGSLVAELVGVIVPAQRLDRLVDFARRLEKRIASLDKEAVRARLTDENFTDLMEEASLEAVRAVTEERREYLAATLASGLDDQRISFVEAKHLLRILGQINDIEVIWLRSYLHPHYLGGEQDEFRQKHKDLLRPTAVHNQSTDEERDKHALRRNYLEHLTSLGLIQQPLTIDSKTGEPIYDKNARMWSTEQPRVTRLGRLLLRQIGFAMEPDS